MIFLVLTLLLGPEQRSAAVSCSDVAALLDLAPSERKTFESVCAGTLVPEAERERLLGGLDRLLRAGDWRATLAMQTLADPPAGAVGADVVRNPALELDDSRELNLSETFARCTAFGPAITQFVEDIEADRLPRQVGLEILQNDRSCSAHLRGEEAEALADLIADHVLVTYVGEPKDRARALFLDSNDLRLVHTSLVLQHPKHRGLQFLVVPRGQRVLLVVEQVEHDVAWTQTRVYNRNVTVGRRSEVACIDTKLTIDEGVDAAIVVDGQILGAGLSERRPGEYDQQRTVINVPSGGHDLLMLVHGVSEQGEIRRLTIPEAIDARLSVEREVQTTANACTMVEHDFHGLRTGQNRYGIARITVDEHCAAAGLWSPRVHQHIEQYASRLDTAGVRLEQLDAWSEALAEFQLLQQQGGPSEMLLDDRNRATELAKTVMRQGVDFLLYFELRCDTETDAVDVFGTSIDLRSFSLRPKSDGVAETQGLRDSRLHTASRVRVREAIDVVLGELFDVGHVVLTAAPTGDRDVTRQITVAAEYPPDEVPAVEVVVFRAPSRDTCNRIDSINALGHDAVLADLRSEIERKDEWVLFGPEPVARQVAKVAAGRMAVWNQTFDVTGLPTGRYVVWIADEEGQRYDARCFEVDERTFEYWMALGAGTRTRGRNIHLNPRDDQVSHMRLTSGLRVHSRRYLVAGAVLGYEHAVYDASTTPSWDYFDDVEYAGNGSTNLEYDRNGLLIGAFTGVELPFCLARSRRNISCNSFARRLSGFIEGAAIGNLGFLDPRSLPADLAARVPEFDPDLDLTLQSGIRILATPIARFGIFIGSHWTDVLATTAGRPTGQTHPAASLAFDYAWRWTLGFELSLSRRTR